MYKKQRFIEKENLDKNIASSGLLWHKRLLSPLWIFLLLGTVLRVWVVFKGNGMVDGDEALVGIQAQHILHGEFPIYFYAQAYMGSLEAYFMAIIFAITDSSVWSLRIEPIMLSLVVVWLTWKLAGALADHARLSQAARWRFMCLAALLAAMAPLYSVVVELRTLGGYIETFVIMLLLLQATLQLVVRWQADASSSELLLRWMAVGFLIGLGFWVDLLIAPAIAAAALWIIGGCCWRIIQLKRQRDLSFGSAFLDTVKKLLLALVAFPFALFGAAPALFWGATHNWENIQYLLKLNSTNVPYRERLHLGLLTEKKLVSCVAPFYLDGHMPTQSYAATLWQRYASGVGIVCLAIIGIAILMSLVMHFKLLQQLRSLTALPLLLAACTLLVFCTSSKTSPLLDFPCQSDFTGRYASPFLLVLPFCIAAVFTLLSLTFPKMDLFLAHVVPRINGMKANQFYAPLTFLTRLSVLLLLIFYLLSQISTYVRIEADPGIFQSSYCLRGPSSNDKIIAYLEQEHVQYAWGVNFVANPIVFKTNSRIVIVDPVAIFHPAWSELNRLPSYTNRVLAADRASFILLVKRSDSHPPLLQLMEAQHITYKMAVFSASAVADSVVLVVTPLNHTFVLDAALANESEWFRC